MEEASQGVERERNLTMNKSYFENLGTLSRDALDHFVYIIGMARGGTTVVRDGLAVHDQILVLPDMTHFMNQVWRYRRKVHQRLLNQIFRLPTFYHEEEVIRGLDDRRKEDVRRYIDTAMSSGDLKLMWHIYPLVYALDRENSKKPERIRCWADKANDFYSVGAVARHFPKGKFIFIVRDPKGAVSSLAKRAMVKETRSYDAAPDITKIVEACISWRRMTQQMLFFKRRYPDRALLVKFEEFLSSPAPSLNQIFRFILGEGLEESLLSERLGYVAYGASNAPTEGGKGIKKEPIERWKKSLGESHAKMVDRLTRKTALKAGYETWSSEPLPGFREILEAFPTMKHKAVILAKLTYLEAFETLV